MNSKLPVAIHTIVYLPGPLVQGRNEIKVTVGLGAIVGTLFHTKLCNRHFDGPDLVTTNDTVAKKQYAAASTL